MLSLLTLTYLYSKSEMDLDTLFEKVRIEIEIINQE